MSWNQGPSALAGKLVADQRSGAIGPMTCCKHNLRGINIGTGEDICLFQFCEVYHFEKGLALAIDMKYYHRQPMELGSKAASKKIDRICFSFFSSFPFWSNSSSLEKPGAILDLILWQPFKNWGEWSRTRWNVRPNMIFHHLGHDMSVGIDRGACALDQKSRRWKLRQ